MSNSRLTPEKKITGDAGKIKEHVLELESFSELRPNAANSGAGNNPLELLNSQSARFLDTATNSEI
jgi:hypothetical protein